MWNQASRWRKVLAGCLLFLGGIAGTGIGVAMWFDAFGRGLFYANLFMAFLLGVGMLRPGHERKKAASIGVVMVIGFLGAIPAYWGHELVAFGALATVMVGVVAIDKVWPNRVVDEVRITQEGVERFAGNIYEKILWVDLVEVGIVTTSDGPYNEDLYWLLMAHDGSGVAIPNGSVKPLIPILQQLPGFDNLAVIQASGCTDDASFVVWQGGPGDATFLANATHVEKNVQEIST